MEININKIGILGGIVKHTAVFYPNKNEEKLSIIIVRYNAIPQTIDLIVDSKLGFSDTMVRINNIVALDDEMFTLISNNQKERGEN